MTATTEPPPAGKRRNPQRVANSPDPTKIPGEPTPMAKMTRTPELAEYTASMRNYLASVEDSRPHFQGRGRENGNMRFDSDSPGSSSGSGTEREASPEFRWMDLASVRREHGSVNLGALAPGHSGSMEMPSRSLRHHHDRSLGPTKEARPHHHYHHQHREHRSESPSMESLLKKRHTAHRTQARPGVQAVMVPSAKKHCTE